MHYTLLLAAAIAVSPVASDGDAFAVLDLDVLLGGDAGHEYAGPSFGESTWPYVALDGEGELFLAIVRPDASADEPDADANAEEEDFVIFEGERGPFGGRVKVGVRAPEGQGVAGALQFVGEDGEPGDTVRFELPADAFTADEAHFHAVEGAYYQRLLDADLPGAAWFRHRRDLATPDTKAGSTDTAADWRRADAITVEDSFELFTGGRAVSENLQLDRTLPATIAGEDTVAIESVEGIRTHAYDWSVLVDGLDPELDPLAAVIPADQHALFFPDFDALIAVADHADEHGAPVLAALEPRTETADTRKRYERQLGIPMSALSRLLGPAVVRSVAVTGSDPYLRTGADVAMLFEGNAKILEPLLQARVTLAAQGVDEAASVNGTLRGVGYAGVRTPDRSLCSYVARIGEDAMVVTNSLAQLDRLLATADGELPALASLDEYVFFRDRYRRGDPEETALLILSDATIRRWCGPRWRIGSSRRSRAAAALAEWQARSVDALVAGEVVPGALGPDEGVPEIGPVTLTDSGVRSELFGGLDFATPILELDLDRVTEDEQDLYLRWRRGYESNWAQFFDPIAIRCTVDAQQLAIDMTVRPLVVDSDYDELVQMASGATLGPYSGDPHEGALIHWVTAFDKHAQSLTRNEMVGFARMLMPNLDPLGWMGSAYAVYADADPFWAELAAADQADSGVEHEFWANALYRLPLALHADVGDPLQLTLFLAGARAFIQQSAPDMLVWENHEHAGRTYVRIAPTQTALDDLDFIEHTDEDWHPPALHYVASGQGLVLSLSEELIQRAIERQVARSVRRAADAGAEPSVDAVDADTPQPWLGKQLAVRVDRDVITLVEAGLVSNGVQPLQQIAWSNLPILDEWKRRWPERDPLEVHALLWGRQLLDPGGGAYVWNEQDQRMESTLYGHPGRPLDGPVLPATAQDIGSAEFGLDFEDQGLRGRVRLTREH